MFTASRMFLSALIACAPAIAFAAGAEAPPEMQGHVKVGDKAPGFTLQDQDGKEHSLKDLWPSRMRNAGWRATQVGCSSLTMPTICPWSRNSFPTKARATCY